MTRARILVVDDDKNIVQVVRTRLQSENYDVDVAFSGPEALNLWQENQYDVMITDMKMPEMDGLELLSQVHQLKKNLPVIILTGCATVENGIHSLEEGAYDYVLKPFNTEKLMLVVREALERRSIGVCTA